MAWRMSWRSYSVVGGDLVTVYWFPDEPDWRTGYVARALGVYGVSREHVDVTGTPEGIASWALAATAYVDEVAAAVAELYRVELRTRRRRKWPVVRRWAEAKYDEATASFMDRVRAAASVYQPVRDVIEQRLAEQEAVRLEAARRAYEQHESLRREAKTRFQAWERRQAVAARRLPDGLTPREMAARGDNPTSWPPEVEAVVGDVASWWEGVRASVRNEHARAQAVREVIEAITTAAAALERAGRPGISAVHETREVLEGWWVDFTWADLPDVERLRTPPDMPVGHLGDGEWDYDLYLPRRMLFTPTWPGEGYFATVTSENVGNSHYTRPRWWKRDVQTFTEDLFPARITYRVKYPTPTVSIPITDHADPAVFVPYVNALAQQAVAVFHALMPGQK